MTSLTADRVRELLSYNPDSGVFTWRVSRPGRKAGSLAGTPDGRGYWRISVDDKSYRAHRLAWLWVHGTWPVEIDHKNQIKTDNRIDNLRPVTRAQNQQNRPRFKNNTSGFSGVSWKAREARWRAVFCMNCVRKELGLFKTPEAANEAIQRYRTDALKAAA